MAKTVLTDVAVRRMRPPQSGRFEVWDAALPGFGLRITENGNRSWILMTRLHGRLIRYTVGAYPALSLSEAREDAREAIRMVARGEDPRDRRKEPDAILGTFAAVAEEFISKSTAGTGWKKEQARLLRKHVIPVLGEKRIEEIRRGDVIALLESIVETKKPILANRTRAVVSKLFSWALDRELIEAHPCTRLGSMMPRERKRERVLTDDEITKLWKTWESMALPFGRLAQLLLVTLQRRGEVAMMRWPDVDLKARVWRLEMTKSGHGHEVPLSALALAILRKIPHVDGTEFVFPAQRRGNGSCDTSPDSNDQDWCAFSGFSKATKTAKTESGLENWRIHDLRRTGATNMAKLGVPKETISRVLNHAEGGVTAIYARHSYFQEKRDALEKWGRRLASIVKAIEREVTSSAA